jgi:hypothetical protein
MGVVQRTDRSSKGDTGTSWEAPAVTRWEEQDWKHVGQARHAG